MYAVQQRYYKYLFKNERKNVSTVHHVLKNYEWCAGKVLKNSEWCAGKVLKNSEWCEGKVFAARTIWPQGELTRRWHIFYSYPPPSG